MIKEFRDNLKGIYDYIGIPGLRVGTALNEANDDVILTFSFFGTEDYKDIWMLQIASDIEEDTIDLDYIKDSVYDYLKNPVYVKEHSTVEKLLLQENIRDTLLSDMMMERSKKSMTKAELIKQVAADTKYTVTGITVAVDAFFNTMMDNLVNGTIVKIHNFGSFMASVQKPRNSVHPQTGEPMRTKASLKLRFKPSRNLLWELNER
jgi:nucleoid DNA-binding protein